MRKNYLTLEERLTKREFLLQFVPEILYKITKTNKILYNGKNLKTMYIVDLVHTLVTKYYMKNELTFNLSSLILKAKYGKYYNDYIKYLVDVQILKLIKNYSTGNSSKEFLLSNNMVCGKMYRIKNTDTKMLELYKKRMLDYMTNIKYDIILPDVRKKLTNDLFDVEIDLEKSLNILNSSLDENTDAYKRNIYSIEAIAENHIFAHFDNYGRMHTNFTILKSQLRKECLYINGNEVVELDIKNSQPLFLCKVIEQNSEIGYNLDEAEYAFYRNLTYSGKFYQYIIDNSEFKNKEEVKVMVYKVLFGRNNCPDNNIFKNLFPNIFGYIVHFKKFYNNYKSMSHILQNLESELVFNKIVKTLVDTFPDIKIITIHDSIIFEKKYESVAKDIFTQKIKKEFNYESILSTK